MGSVLLVPTFHAKLISSLLIMRKALIVRLMTTLVAYHIDIRPIVMFGFVIVVTHKILLAALFNN